VLPDPSVEEASNSGPPRAGKASCRRRLNSYKGFPACQEKPIP